MMYKLDTFELIVLGAPEKVDEADALPFLRHILWLCLLLHVQFRFHI